MYKKMTHTHEKKGKFLRCIYVYTYIHMYVWDDDCRPDFPEFSSVCVCVCVCVCVYICKVCAYIHIYTYDSVCIYTHIHMFTSIM